MDNLTMLIMERYVVNDDDDDDDDDDDCIEDIEADSFPSVSTVFC